MGQLQSQLLQQQHRRDADAKAKDDAAALAALEDKPNSVDDDLDGEPAQDEELEAQAEAEMLEEVESEVSSRRDEGAKDAAERKVANPPQRAVATPVRNSDAPVDALAVLKRLHSSRDAGKPAAATAVSESGPSLPGPSTAPPTEAGSAPPAESEPINSATHKREYMRLVPGLQIDFGLHRLICRL